MEPVELILSALATGAAAAASEVASSAIKGLYQKLVDLVSKKLEKHPKGKSRVEDFLEDPKTHSAPMKKVIEESKLDGDTEVLALARKLLSEIESSKELSKFNVSFHIQGGTVNSQVIQGDHATGTMNVNAPLPVKKKITSKKTKK